MDHQRYKLRQRRRRTFRVRKKLHGTADRPRLSVFRSSKHIYAQLIDDDRGCTLASASSRDKETAAGFGGNIAAAAAVGKAIAERAVAAGVQRAAFDRGRFKYHGRVAALADAVREGGISF